jgi:hypothetical protein
MNLNSNSTTIQLLLELNIPKNNNNNRIRSYTRPRLSSIDELSPSVFKLEMRCCHCGYINVSYIKQFICRNCKKIN